MAPDLNEAALKKLIDKPAVLSSSVKELPKDAEGVLWFSLFCDAHVVSSVPIDKLYATLNDYAAYPKNFGAKSVKIIRSSPEGNVVEAMAGKLGVNSRYVYTQSEPINKDDEHLIVKISIDGEGDGTMKNMDTQYYLKTVTIDGKSYTYIRNKDLTDFKSQITGQFTTMKLSNDSSHKGGLTDLIKAAGKRS
jgi:hypothetical protein